MTLRRVTAALGAVAMTLACTAPATASGPVGERPWYLDPYGGSPADAKAFWAGHVGVVMPTAPRPILFIGWRLLHGLKVGPAAGDALSSPCCDGGFTQHDFNGGMNAWAGARRSVLGLQDGGWVNTEKAGPDHTYAVNCFDDAFDVAASTLKDRASRYGESSPAVRAWLAGQDAVFKACHDAGVTMPPLPADAAAWLKADRAYQAAALALYDGRHGEAAQRFEAIARDAGSPWRAWGLYLSARALSREALAVKTPEAWAQARAALARLAAAPPTEFGHNDVRPMTEVLDFREHPDAYMARVGRELFLPEPTTDISSIFRDYSELGDKLTAEPEVLDWMATMRAAPPANPLGSPRYHDEMGWQVADQAAAKAAAFAHAQAKWRSGHDPAWLVAALSLADPGQPEAALLTKDALAVPAGSPAWLSTRFHAARLDLGRESAARSRGRLDAILRRRDLSVSDRSVFEALRAQTASGVDDFARHALRRRLCDEDTVMFDSQGERKSPACVRDRWDNATVQPSGVYDGVGDKGRVGLGEDARAVIDRAPLATRMAIAASPSLPPALRLDVALTSYGRAVVLQDDAAVDRLSNQLAELMPLMAADFLAIPAAKTGPDKRFAEFFVLAKIPGVRIDLGGAYTRPEGRSVAAFQTHWADWIIMPASASAPGPHRPLPLAAYQQGGTGAYMDYRAVDAGYDPRGITPDGQTDLACLGECGRGATPLRLPDFVAAGQGAAARERARFVVLESRYDGKHPPYPAGGISAWEEMLAYIQAHPADPRAPEALHWLVHVGHFGGSHNHSGRRAFRLLHARYEGSYWAKKTPFYND